MQRMRNRVARLAEDPSLAPHGVRNTYKNWGCRCEPCTAANSAYTELYRDSREAVRPECGTYAGHQWHRKRGERPCGPCRQARKEYRYYNERERAKGNAMTKPAPVMPARSGNAYVQVATVPYPDASQALCTQADPELWFPDSPAAAHGKAVAICRACPVMQECLAWALATNEEFGIWGATTRTQRREIKRTAQQRPIAS